MYTVPNQKIIVIHKDKPDRDFLQIKNEHWMEVNKKYGPYALQLYLYLAKNANSYEMALSQAAAEEEAGIKKTTFHKYLDLFIREGYLVKRNGNTYDFYEMPRKQKEEETERSPCDEHGNSQDGSKNPLHESRSSVNVQECAWDNKEIDNRYTDKIDTDTIYFEKRKETEVAEKQFYF